MAATPGPSFATSFFVPRRESRRDTAVWRSGCGWKKGDETASLPSQGHRRGSHYIKVLDIHVMDLASLLRLKQKQMGGTNMEPQPVM